MPRKARVDAPGALHHIICRGIERRKIFMDDADKNNLVARLRRVIFESQTPCYAWALMTNDNLRAAGLYLSRGYRLVRVHLDAVDRVREYKPKLPEKGYEGIRIKDLWEFEKLGPLGIPVP